MPPPEPDALVRRVSPLTLAQRVLAAEAKLAAIAALCSRPTHRVVRDGIDGITGTGLVRAADVLAIISEAAGPDDGADPYKGFDGSVL